VTCIRLDATVVTAHSDKELAEGNFKGYGHHPLLAVCDNTGGEPLAWMLRRGSAGSNTAADHTALTDAAIAVLPPAFRRKLMITVDGAGASHELVKHLDKLAARPGYQVFYSVGWALTGREKTALRLIPGQAWQIAIDGRGEVRECSATLTVSVSGLIGVIEGERAGFARVLVAGCAARRHRERVGFGAALPVIFWRSLGEGRGRVQRSTGAHGRQRRRARRADAGRGRFVLPGLRGTAGGVGPWPAAGGVRAGAADTPGGAAAPVPVHGVPGDAHAAARAAAAAADG
jgi:hypothetical protein